EARGVVAVEVAQIPGNALVEDVQAETVAEDDAQTVGRLRGVVERAGAGRGLGERAGRGGLSAVGAAREEECVCRQLVAVVDESTGFESAEIGGADRGEVSRG